MSATSVTRAWSCTVRLVTDDARALGPATADLHALLARVDTAASRFRADSALTRANASAGRPVPVPALLAELVTSALDAARYTDGAVDPTLGRELSALGYDRDISAVTDGGPPPAAQPPRRSWRDVRLHAAAGLLTVPAGTALDLGSSAKARTADLAAQSLARRYDTAVLVELGGDLAIAGERPDGWCLRVAERENGPGQLITLRSGGLATSTTTVRKWRRGTDTVHHIIDPRTGAPAHGPWRTATVAGPDALHANAASTAAIVLGDAALDWLDAHGCAARLVAQDGRVHTTGEWPSEVEVAA